MNKYIAFCLTFLMGSTISAQTINLSGTVSTRTGQPVADAVITLVGQAMKDTTGNDGKYSFTKNTTATLPAIVPQLEEISIKSGVLQITPGSSSPVKIEIFDIKGNLLKNEILADASAGAYRVDIAKNCFATNLLVIKVTLGKREMSFPCVMLDNGNYSLYRFGAYASSAGYGLKKMLPLLTHSRSLPLISRQKLYLSLHTRINSWIFLLTPRAYRVIPVEAPDVAGHSPICEVVPIQLPVQVSAVNISSTFLPTMTRTNLTG